MWQYSIHRDGDACIVVLSGELDLTVGNDLTDVLLQQIDRSGATAVHVDLSAVTFLDSWIIGELVRAHQAATTAGRRLRVLNPRGHVRRVLDVTGVLAMLGSDPLDPR